MCALPLSPQALDGAELKLFDRAFASPELCGNFTNAFLLNKAHMNHTELRFREPVHQLKQDGTSLKLIRSRIGELDHGFARLASRPLNGLAARAFKMGRHRPQRDPQQPCGKRRSAPLELANSCKCLAEYV